ncbi:hypothetical protein THAOC_24109 [Thalassiosira oceanica]|uniref:Uncharacterized protein n=1 Tax=Thalassiosira oceanica TaxID=159749 RepID=K0RUH1_THAOC|nr:hypothetical protein THAOC_24109 [Thalassiosira oceanica]|eukprot:EJK56069.1 hypothetical protein THAOC_24109 [Thalassiosira oceanica]
MLEIYGADSIGIHSGTKKATPRAGRKKLSLFLLSGVSSKISCQLGERGGLQAGESEISTPIKNSLAGTRTLVSCVKGKYDNHLHHKGA